MVLKVERTQSGERTLVLDEALLRQVVDGDADEFEVASHDGIIEIRPIRADRGQQVREIAERVMRQHDSTFRKLSQ